MKNLVKIISKKSLTTNSFRHIEVKKINCFIEGLFSILFPNNGALNIETEEDVILQLNKYKSELIQILRPFITEQNIKKTVENFFDDLSEILKELHKDAESFLKSDPAAKSINEVILCYPGMFAIFSYRIANYFYNNKVEIFPRVISEYAHKQTGIDIHPGADIGSSFFIDHGTGVVIGETTKIGNNVKIYQGVTLGALSVDKVNNKEKRHPNIEDNCIIYSNATILGGDTTIGENSIIGGNAWITKSIAKNSIAYHKSEIKLRKTKL